jgi:hypothetical protein
MSFLQAFDGYLTAIDAGKSKILGNFNWLKMPYFRASSAYSGLERA